MKILFLSLFIVTSFVNCKPHKTIIGNSQLKAPDDDCIYQRFKFIGSETFDASRGLEVLDSLSVVLNLEKNEILNNGLTNELKIRGGNILKEGGEISVPITNEMATKYTELANKICQLRRDLINDNVFKSKESRAKAEAQYLNLYSFIEEMKNDVKKKSQ